MRAMDDAVRRHLNWIDTQFRLGVNALHGLGAKAAKDDATQSTPEPFQSLKSRALERMHKGLPPPREVYDAQNRSRIDWSASPDWARPADPELFEGCSHEG
jgi:hypothetical protein